MRENVPEQEGKMPLTGHLRELRNRAFVCLGVLAFSMACGLFIVRSAVGHLLELGARFHYTFVYLSPQELLMAYAAADFFLGVCTALPVVLYEVWAFVRPGLKRRERVFCLLSMLFGLLFAAIGVLFAYKILIPFMLRFLISMSVGSGVRSAVSVQNYLSLLFTLFLVFAAVFELPVVTLLLTQLGIIRVSWMKKVRKPAVVSVFFIAGVITPPDVVSQILVALPLLALYELSILLCTLAARLRRSQNC